MNSRKLYLIATGFSLLYGGISSPILASSAVLSEVKGLYDAGQAREAFILASKHSIDLEGDSAFDYLYGLAALGSGQLSQGVFAFERVLVNEPNHLRARLELARGFFLLEQFDQAKEQFNKVLEAEPPESVISNIKSYLETIAKREGRYTSSHSYYVELGAGYDSNVNSGPQEATIETPTLGTATLDDASVSNDDSFMLLRGGADYTFPINPGLSFVGRVSGKMQQNLTEDDFDIGSLDGLAGIVLHKDLNTFQLSLQGGGYWVGGDNYRNLMGLTAEVRHQLSPSSRISGYIQTLDLDYVDIDNRSGTQTTLGGGYLRALTGKYQPLIYTNLYIGTEKAKEDNSDAEILVDRDIIGLRVGTQLTINSKVTAGVMGQYIRSKYDAYDPIFEATRDDDFLKLEANVKWNFRKNWTAQGVISYRDNSSSIAIHDYDGGRAELTFRYTF